MKINNFSKLTQIAWVMLMALAVITTSCKKDDEEDPGTPPVVVLDGLLWLILMPKLKWPSHVMR